jgi:hypothetical protein
VFTYPKCNIESFNTTDRYSGGYRAFGWSEIYGYANNTGRYGYCTVVVKLYEDNVITNRNLVPIDTKTEELYLEKGERKPFRFDISNYGDTVRSFDISIDDDYHAP